MVVAGVDVTHILYPTLAATKNALRGGKTDTARVLLEQHMSKCMLCCEGIVCCFMRTYLDISPDIVGSVRDGSRQKSFFANIQYLS
jgi:hypothetical protein